jgi:hypothetical protein
MTINALPTVAVAAITGTPTVCVGLTTTLADVTTGGTWTSTSTGVATVNSTTGVVTGATAGTVTVNYTVTSGGCTNSVSATVAVNPAAVSGSLTGGTTPIVLGQSIGTLTLSGYTGTIIKWQEYLPGGASWTDIVNNTTTLSDIPNVIGTWQYRSVVQSGSCAAVYTTPVTIVVSSSVAGAVTGGTTPICLGSSTGTLTLAGNTGTIQNWEKRVDFAATWTSIVNTATIYSEIPSSAGTWDYRAVTDNSGTLSYSAPSTIFVNAATAGGTVTGGSNICSGSTSGLLTLSGQTGTVVKWQSSVSPFSTWSDIANTATAFTSGALAETTQFRAVVQSGNCAPANSAAATVTVDPAAVSGSLTGGTTPIVLGQSIGTLTLSGYTGTIIKWQEYLPGGASWTDIVNNTTTLSDIPNVIGTWQYRAVVQSGSCAAVYTTPVTIVVSSSVAGAVTGGTTPICLGSSTATMTLSGHTGVIVNWEKRIDSGAWTSVANTATTYAEVPSSAGTWDYRAVTDNSGTLSYSAPSTIFVNAATVGGTVSGGSNICSGSVSGLLMLSGHTGTVVKWQSSVSPFSTWTDIANTATTYTSGSLTETTQFRAVVQSGNCASANSAAATVTVDLSANGGIISGIISSTIYGSSTGDMTLSGHNGSVVKWQKSIISGVWIDINNTYTTCNETPSSIGTWQYRALVKNGACSESFSNVFSITVSPKALTVEGTVAQSKIYNGNNTAQITGAILVGRVGTDNVTLANNISGIFAQEDIGTDIAVATLPMTLAGADMGNYILIQPTGLKANITSKALNIVGITADSKVYDGSNTATFSGTASLLGVESGDVLSLDGIPVITFASANVANDIVVNVTGYTISGVKANNYTLTQPTVLTANITPRVLTVTGVAADSKIYDGNNSAQLNISEYSLLGIVSSDLKTLDILSYTATFNDAMVGNDKPIEVSGLNLAGTQVGNYTIIPPTGLKANITAKPIIVTPDAGQFKVVGTSDPDPFTYIIEPALVGSDILSGVMGRAAGESAGTYAFTLGSLAASPNYSLSIADAPTFTIKAQVFSVYPVPSDGLFTVVMTYPEETTFAVNIYNPRGEKILEIKDAKTISGIYEKLLDLRPIPTGIYYVEFVNSKFKEVRKVLVNR